MSSLPSLPAGLRALIWYLDEHGQVRVPQTRFPRAARDFLREVFRKHERNFDNFDGKIAKTKTDYSKNKNSTEAVVIEGDFYFIDILYGNGGWSSRIVWKAEEDD